MNLGLLLPLCGKQFSKLRGAVEGSWRGPLASVSWAVTISTRALVWMWLRRGGQKVGSGEPIDTKEWIITKSLFCFSSCVENICSVMRAAVGLKTHCRAADKRPHSSCITMFSDIFTWLTCEGLSCQLDLLASVISFSCPFPFRGLPASPPLLPPMFYTSYNPVCMTDHFSLCVPDVCGGRGSRSDGDLGDLFTGPRIGRR